MHIIGRGRYGREAYPQPKFGIASLLHCESDAVLTTYNLTTVDPDYYLLPKAEGPPATALTIDIEGVQVGDLLEIIWQASFRYNPGAVGAPSSGTFGAYPVVSADAGVSWNGVVEAWDEAHPGDITDAPGLREGQIGGTVMWQSTLSGTVRVGIGTYTNRTGDASFDVGVNPGRPCSLIVQHYRGAFSAPAYTLDVFAPVAPPFG